MIMTETSQCSRQTWVSLSYILYFKWKKSAIYVYKATQCYPPIIREFEEIINLLYMYIRAKLSRHFDFRFSHILIGSSCCVRAKFKYLFI